MRNITEDDSDKRRIRQMMLTLTALCITVVLAGINRKLSVPFLREPVTDVFRMCDYIVVFFIAPATVFFLYLLIKINKGTQSFISIVIFIFGVYLLGVGFGMHEPMNAITVSGSLIGEPTLIRTFIFFDDELGHWVFFAGFMLISIAVAWSEICCPYNKKMKWNILLPVWIIGLLTALVIYLNMVREKTGHDIAVIIVTVAVIGILHLFNGRSNLKRVPVVFTCYIAYGGGALVTLLHWCFF